jgi:hypothetical protein
MALQGRFRSCEATEQSGATAVSDTIEPLDDAAIRALVTRLARPLPSGGEVIERAAILAEGTKSAAILVWIAEHDWEPEDAAPAVAPRGGLGGLHGMREGTPDRAPRRYVLRAGAAS